jgi:hypothetical protein
MRFTIRDLLWLTVVVALGVAWWREFRRSEMLDTRLRLLNGALAAQLNWSVTFDHANTPIIQPLKHSAPAKYLPSK